MKSLIPMLAITLAFSLAKADLCRDVFSGPAPMLYSVTKDHTTSFLYGTFNRSVSASAIPTLATSAMKRVQNFMREFDSEFELPEGSFKNPTGSKLSDSLPADTWNIVKLQFPWVSDDIVPALPYLQYLENSQREAFGDFSDVDKPMDVALQSTARREQRRVIFLEKADEVVNSYAAAVSPKLLQWTLSEGSSVEVKSAVAKSLRAQRVAYLDGDLVSFTREFENFHAILKNETVYKEVVQERNRKWIKKLNEKQMQGGYFFAVDAGHLGGPEGLIELLDAEGYIIRRVKQKADLSPQYVQSLESRIAEEKKKKAERDRGR